MGAFSGGKGQAPCEPRAPKIAPPSLGILVPTQGCNKRAQGLPQPPQFRSHVQRSLDTPSSQDRGTLYICCVPEAVPQQRRVCRSHVRTGLIKGDVDSPQPGKALSALGLSFSSGLPNFRLLSGPSVSSYLPRALHDPKWGFWKVAGSSVCAARIKDMIWESIHGAILGLMV